MTEKTAEWYDANLDIALIETIRSPWFPLYEEVCLWTGRNESIVDLGCGTGRLARLLADREHYGTYLGLDFSRKSIEEARRYVTEANFAFRVHDITEGVTAAHDGNTVYVSTEVLEHIESDLEVVADVPPGARFVFSVPNYDSASHVRFFPQPRDAFERYASLLQFNRWSAIDLSPPVGRRIHLFETVRRHECL